MKKMYVVKYDGGQYEDYFERDLFVTESIELAQKYVAKFNAMLEKWRLYYDRLYYDCDWGNDNDWRKSLYFNRGDCVLEIHKCYYTEIEVR